jgi:hypothetical protein
MKRTLRVLPEAEAELQSAAMWYEEKRRGLGIELVAAVDRALTQAFPIRRVLRHRLGDGRDCRCGARQATPWLLAGSSALGRLAEPSKEARPNPDFRGGDPNDT